MVVLMHGNSSPEAAIQASKVLSPHILSMCVSMNLLSFLQNVMSILNPKPQFGSNKSSHARAVELPAQTTCISQVHTLKYSNIVSLLKTRI